MIAKFQRFKMPAQVIVSITAILLLCPLPAPASKKVENESSAWESSQSFKGVAKKAMPTVVFIKVEKTIERGQTFGPLEFNNPFDLFNTQNMWCCR